MKNVMIAFAAFISLSSFAPWQTITGNGNLQKETRTASGYTGISLSGNMNVQVAYGNANSITVEADENLLPYIETTIENGILEVKSKDKVNLKSKNKLMVYVSLTKLTELRVSGSGNVIGEGDFSNDGKTSISLSGSGNINLKTSSFKETRIAISGSGNVTLKGNSTNNIDAAISGSGNIDCSDMACDDVFAHVSGSGNIRVFVNKSIDARVVGSGNIYYKGAATNITLKSVGSGKIIKS